MLDYSHTSLYNFTKIINSRNNYIILGGPTMNTNNDKLTTDVYIKTEHQKKKKNSKVSFSVIINKVLVSAVILTTIAGATTPVEAATDITAKYNDVINKYNSGANITQNYEVSVESAIYNVKSTIEAIEQMKSKGVVNQEILQELANQISELDRAVNIEGKGTSQEVADVILSAENTIKGITDKNVIPAQIAIAVAKQSLGIKSEVVNQEVKPAKAVKLSDIANHWGKPYIERLVALGSINGYNDGTFKPNNTISLAEFLSISINSFYKGEVRAKTGSEHWAAPVYELAVKKGIINSHEFKGTKESFDSTISREDMALIMVRLNEISQGNAKVSTTNTKSMIQDYSKIASNRTYFVEQAYQKGLLNGKDNGFDPKGNLTRAEAATAIINLLDYKPGTVIDVPQVVQNDIAYTKGVYTGRMRIEKATEYHLQALKTAKFYTEGGKYYVSVDLPQLPEGFKWRMSIGAYDKNGDYIFYTMNKDYTGVTGKQVVEVYSKYEGKTLKDIDVATLSVFVANEKMESMLGHKLSTKAPNQVLRQSSVDSSDASWETFNTSGIFNWK